MVRSELSVRQVPKTIKKIETYNKAILWFVIKFNTGLLRLKYVMCFTKMRKHRIILTPIIIIIIIIIIIV
jgi:hypothetical protein